MIAMLGDGRRFAILLVAFCAMTLAGTASRAQWGNLKGKFVYDGTAPTPTKLTVEKDVEVCGKHNLVAEDLVVGADGGLANVIVYLRTRDAKEHPDYAQAGSSKVDFDNKNCRFEPHVLAIRTSQTLVLKNSDPVAHNSNVQQLDGGGINPLIPPNGAAEHKFFSEQPVPVTVSCNIHPWMKGYIMPRKSPYFAVSGKDGSFQIKNLPAGELEFVAWQEKSGYLAVPGWERGRFTVKIAEGDNDLGTIKCPASLFNK